MTLNNTIAFHKVVYYFTHTCFELGSNINKHSYLNSSQNLDMATQYCLKLGNDDCGYSCRVGTSEARSLQKLAFIGICVLLVVVMCAVEVQ